VDQLSKVMPGETSAYEVILVVDGSPDNTWDVAKELSGRYSSVRAIRLARNYGQHNALIAGVRAARYELVITMDDDLQHPPDQLPVLLKALTDDLDLVYGVAEEEEHGFLRSLASRSVKLGLATVLGVREAKSLSALRVFRTFLRDGFDGLQGPHAEIDVAFSWGTTRIGAATVRMDDRANGRSNYSVKKLFGHALNMVLGYSTRPLRAVSYLGLGCAALGLALLGYVLWVYFVGDTTVAGFTSIASMVALFSGAQMLAIGVLGEYVGRLHSGGMGRPTYVVRERTDTDAHPDIDADPASPGH
jgi:undecaprenyl-phosphate 4-deoxy-4-formamido-L-arabinose transferase